MTAGLPGTGIGGLFYLISALLMPVREAWRTVTGRGRARDLRVAVRQSAMALAILGVAWLTSFSLAAAHVGTPQKEANVLWITMGTLAAVLVGVELLSATIRFTSWVGNQLSGQAPASGGDR